MNLKLFELMHGAYLTLQQLETVSDLAEGGGGEDDIDVLKDNADLKALLEEAKDALFNLYQACAEKTFDCGDCDHCDGECGT